MRRAPGGPLTAVLVIVVVAAGVVVLLTRGDASPDRAATAGAPVPGSAPTAPTGPAHAPSEPTVAPVDPPRPPYDVVRTDVAFTDPDTERAVDAAVWYPATKVASPLVVFGHGFATSP